MHFHSTVAVAGAAFFSVASAGRVCKLKTAPGNSGSSGWAPANVQPKPAYSNWDGSPIVVRTTTLAHANCNPQPTGLANWAGWSGSPSTGLPVSPTSTVAPGQGWVPWNTVGANPSSTSLSAAPTGITTTISGTVTVLPTSATTMTTITTTTTTATTTTTTTAAACPSAPAGVFYLQAQTSPDDVLNNKYAGLANNNFGNLVAFSEADTTNAVQVTFDVNCNLVSALGPLIILDVAGADPTPYHYQYMNDEGTEQAGLVRTVDICSADANNVLSCSVAGQSILQTDGDILAVGDAQYGQEVTVVLVPVPVV